MSNSEGMHSPVEQFEIKPLVELSLGGYDVSFTNSSLFMLLAIGVSAIFLISAMRRADMVPGRMQGMAEMMYEFVAEMVQTTTPALTALASILVVAGHCFPIWLKFNGGKGVATSLAVMAALDLRLGAVFVVVWLMTAFLSRYSSLSALLAMGACVLAGFGLLDSKMIKIAILVLGGIVWSRHHTNIGRLLSGTETKIGAKKS